MTQRVKGLDKCKHRPKNSLQFQKHHAGEELRETISIGKSFSGFMKLFAQLVSESRGHIYSRAITQGDQV